MKDAVSELKVQAELLHRAVVANDPAALARLRGLRELRKAEPDELRRAAGSIQRKHCLATVALEHGFASWEHARQVLTGGDSDEGFGKLLAGQGRGAFLNHWFSTYEEARAVHLDLRATAGTRYLLAFQRQCFITEAGYIEALGLDPEDTDWRSIDWDWVRPRSMAARGRLYAKLVGQRRAA
jgi:hypothetical protein